MAQHAHQQAIFTAHAASIPAPSEPSVNKGTARSLPPTPLASTLSPLPGSARTDRKATSKGKGIDRCSSASHDDVAGMVPVTPVFPPTPATPLTPAPATPGYSPTEICASEAGEETTKTAPYFAPGEDSDSEVDEIGVVQGMDEEGQWFEIEATQLRYPERMRDKRGETDDAKLLANDALRDAFDMENPYAAQEAKKVLHKRLKKERKHAAKEAHKKR